MEIQLGIGVIHIQVICHLKMIAKVLRLMLL